MVRREIGIIDLLDEIMRSDRKEFRDSYVSLPLEIQIGLIVAQRMQSSNGVLNTAKTAAREGKADRGEIRDDSLS
jgi:hypothetical protein